MAKLSLYHIKRALVDIQPQLAKAARQYAEQILEVMGENDATTVDEVHQTLFPFSTRASANSQLNRLISEINTASRESGLSLCLMISPDKKLGPQRSLWFEGEVEGPTSTDTPELYGTSNLIEDTRGLIADNPVVALMTFNEHERDAVLERFSNIGPRHTRTIDEIDYVQLGVLNGNTIVHLHCHNQGQVNAVMYAGNVIRHWHPNYIIAVGIAAGLDNEKQEIGDVLVPSAVEDTEMVRLNAEGTTTDRNAIYPVFSKLDPLRN